VLGNLLQRFWLESQGGPGQHRACRRPLGGGSEPPPTIPCLTPPCPRRTRRHGPVALPRKRRAQVAGAATTSTTCPRCAARCTPRPSSPRGPRPLNGVDASAALALPGVRGVVLAPTFPATRCWPPLPRRAHLRPGHGAARRPGDRPGGGRHGDAGAPRRARRASSTSRPCPPC
jgi:hypothetical protein